VKKCKISFDDASNQDITPLTYVSAVVLHAHAFNRNVLVNFDRAETHTTAGPAASHKRMRLADRDLQCACGQHPINVHDSKRHIPTCLCQSKGVSYRPPRVRLHDGRLIAIFEPQAETLNAAGPWICPRSTVMILETGLFRRLLMECKH
jgi:hypothetical protein